VATHLAFIKLGEVRYGSSFPMPTALPWLSMAVAIGLPALMFIAMVIVHVGNPR